MSQLVSTRPSPPTRLLISVLGVALLFSMGGLATPVQAQGEAPNPSAIEMPSFDGSVLAPATMTYEASRSWKSSTSPLAVTISEATHDGQPAWRVETEGGVSPAGVLHLDRSTLHPVAHRTEDGVFDLTYEGTTVTGTAGKGNRTTSVDTTVGAPVLDGKSSNVNIALAGISLENGQSFSLRTFDPLGPSVNVITCAVTGTKTVEVPAGTFETYVVKMESSQPNPSSSGTTYLRARAPHYVIKSEVTLETGGDMSMTIKHELSSMN